VTAQSPARSSSLVLTSFPAPATREEYDTAAAELEARLAEVPGAVAVYGYGSVGAPGISDLDRIVVTDADASATTDVWSQLSPRTRQLAMHAPAAIDTETYARHRWFAELGRPELAWGTEVPIEECPCPAYAGALLAAEALVVIRLKLAKQELTGRIKVRPTLCELHNVRLDLQLAGVGRADAAQAWALADAVQDLRQSWWSLDDAARDVGVRTVVGEAPAALDDALAAVAAQQPAAPEADPLTMGGAWRNVRLVANDRPSASASRALTWLVAKDRRAGEARWRMAPRELSVPPGVLRLLAGPVHEDQRDYRRDRDALVRRHVAYLEGFPGFAGLAMSTVFLAR
jgi:hypothetical protein